MRSSFSWTGEQMVKLFNLRFERSEKCAERSEDKWFFFGVLRSIKNPRFAWSKTLTSLDRKPSLRSIANPRCARSKTLAALESSIRLNLDCSTRKIRLRIRFVSLFLCLLWLQLNKIAELAIKFWLNWRTLTMSVTSMAYKWSNFRILRWPRDTVSKHSLLWSTSGMETLWHSMVSCLAIYDHNNCWLKK